METVSVIIPVYNAQDYVERCLTSVMDQSYRDLEILVIDDGSTDRSAALLDRLASQDDRIRLVHQANAGVAAARNRGLDMATGTYVTFVDGDDYIARHYILRLYRRMRETGAGMVICGLDYVTEQGKVLRRLVPRRYERNSHEEWPMRISAVCSHFYRRSLWEEEHIRFTPGERGEDMPISLYFSAVCDKISILPRSGYAYVQHASSATHQFRGLRQWQLPCRALEESIRKVRQKGVANSEDFFQLFILRILATCLFDLARGARWEKKRELAAYIERILTTYLPDYAANPLIGPGGGTDFPLSQKAAVWLLVQLAKRHLLYAAARFL